MIVLWFVLGYMEVGAGHTFALGLWLHCSNKRS